MEVGVQYALAVPTQIGESHPGGGGLRRLSIQADAATVDLVLSAAMPIGSLIPPVVDVLARSTDFRGGPVPVRYQLSIPGSAALDSSKTLSQLGIRDGTVLLLTCSSAELMAPRFDDAAEAVSASVAVLERRWTRRGSRLVGSLVATWLAGVTAAVMIRTAFVANDSHHTGSAVVDRNDSPVDSAGSGQCVSRFPRAIRRTGAGPVGYRLRRANRPTCRPRQPQRAEYVVRSRGCRSTGSDHARNIALLNGIHHIDDFRDDRSDRGLGRCDRGDPAAGYRRSVRGDIVGGGRSVGTGVDHACAAVSSDGAHRRCAILQPTSAGRQSNPRPHLAYRLDRGLLGLGRAGSYRRGTWTVPGGRATLTRSCVRHPNRRSAAIAGAHTPRPGKICAAHHLWNGRARRCSPRRCRSVSRPDASHRRSVGDAGRRRAVSRFR